MADEEVQVRVKVTVGPHTFNIPCGRGEQNMKWLACVVAQRYRLMSQSNGRARQREAKKTPPGCFVPCNVTNSRGQTVYPSIKVKDAVLDGSTEVKVQLKTSEGREDDGAASQTTWAALAFNFSDNGRKRAEKLRQKELEKAREAEAVALKEAEAREQAKIDAMAKLLAVDLDSPKQVAAAMKENWPYLRFEKLRPTPSPTEVKKLKQVILTHYVGLSDLYKHYSGSSSSGSVASMNKLEFQHVLIVCRVMDVAKEKKVVEDLFVEANRGRNEDPLSDARSLTRFEFFETLLNLAMKKFSIDRSTGERLSASGAFKRLLQIHMLPRIAQMAAGIVRTAMQTLGVTKYYAQRVDMLRRVYDRYSVLASDQGLPDNRDTVNLKEFCQLLQDARLLRDDLSSTHSGGGGEDADLSLTAAREIFAGVQRDEGPDAKEIENPMQELVFSEFLEAVARIGFVRWRDEEGLSPEARIKRAIDRVVKLDPMASVATKPSLSAMFHPVPRSTGGAGAGAGAGSGAFTKSFITEGAGLPR